MTGANTWMSTPTSQWKKILPFLGPTKFQLDKIKTGGKSGKSAFNPAHGLSPEQTPGPNQIEVRELSIPGRNNSAIRVRTYTPANARSTKLFPILTWAHHGGWKFGDLEMDDSTCRYISLHCNFVVVNIDYALVPNRFPTALNNVHDVVLWISQNATQIYGDPALGFVVGGSSAGANMSAVITHLTKNSLPHPITGQLLTVGWFMDQKHKDMLDVPQQWVADMTSLEDNKDAALISAQTIQAMMAPDWLDVPDSSDPTFSPCLFPQSSFEGLPPAYIQVAGQDPFRDEGYLYAKQLERGGAAAKVQPFPGVPHAWFEFPQLDETKRFVPDLVEGLKWLQERHLGVGKKNLGTRERIPAVL